MAGVNALADHPLYTETALPLTTTSGVHAATIAEYAVTMLLALAHRVPRVVAGARRLAARRAALAEFFVPSEVRGATLGIIGYGSIGRELARIAKSAFGMTVLAGKRDPSGARTTATACPAPAIRRAACPTTGSAWPSSTRCWHARTWWCCARR